MIPWPDSPDALKAVAVKQMKDILGERVEQHRNDPDPFVEVEKPEEKLSEKPKDPWGTPYRVWKDMRSAEGGGMTGRIVITSAGPDKRFGTADDLERHSRFLGVYNTGSEPDFSEMLTEGPAPPLPEE